jgi:trans-2,3-dihydro-3-hydroxyanthranilate isomerase
MPGCAYDFIQLDVFTRTRLTGNPLAIFPDARGLTDAEMQAVAREMNLSETTFILPREEKVEAKQGKRVRIFTVAEELPFAGHPTLGTALHLYAAAGGCDELVLDLNVGKVPVRFTADAENAGRERVDGKVFGEMRQRDPEFGPTLSREDLARVLGCGADEIASEWPIQVVSTGLPFAIVPIRNLNTLAALQPNIGEVTAFLKETAAKFCYFISLEKLGDQSEVRARMFFYGGEDPATGSAAGCAAAWLARYGLMQATKQVLIRQGVEAGRPSEIFVRAAREGDRVTDVRVAGYAVEVLRGTADL